MDVMTRGDEHGKAMHGESYLLLRPERRGTPVLSRESVCVNANLKDTPRIVISFAFTGVGMSVQALVNRNKGSDSTHSKYVWLRLPCPPLQSCLWAPQNRCHEPWQIEHEFLAFSFCVNM